MLGGIQVLDLVLGSCSLVVTSSMRNVSPARRYTNLDLVLGSCNLVLRSSIRYVSCATRYTNHDLVLGS